MAPSIKKIISYLLIVVVLLFTVIALLGIWDVIVLEDIMKKMFGSLFVIFASAAVILFIIAVLMKEPDEKQGKRAN